MSEQPSGPGRIRSKTAGHIVVGTDGSDRAYKAVSWAAERAIARGLPLLVVMVIPGPQVGRTFTAMNESFQEQFKGRCQQRLNAEVEQLRREYPEVDVSSELVEGYASYVLAQASKDAAQVVVGARGRGAPVSVKLLGGVSDAVTTHSHGPVAVITDESWENQNGPVIVGIDDSNEARAAARVAFEAADLRKVPLVVIHAWDYAMIGTPWEYDIWDESMSQIMDELTAQIKNVFADVQAQYPDVEVDLRVIDSSPAQALIDASVDAGLVVVGSRGRGGFAGLLLGSTSKRVLREAHCPVIVTRAEQTDKKANGKRKR
ncbi:universal stress protein [Propionimicrobium sp. PCR01-08-3]|uniref:universal stress protein n=1 Tax=Propionimicrobium sp. PCR01-08-3 TaxID=3052086 RepID=UPI00255D0764|nr:universal stress protein [Propionimicrobium sp. PCR01-08-3]WIY84153.1 universal stress protein [Propionimicrobium sp. PCR01-08-3]